MGKKLWRPLRVFNYSWHTSHQHTLMTSWPYSQWSMLQTPYRRWGYEARPLPPNVNFVPFYEEGKYDLAVLHLDSECAKEESRPHMKKPKGHLYDELNELITDIPKIVIVHSSPWTPEPFEDMFHEIEDEERKQEAIIDYIKDQIRKKTEGNYVVMNSRTAAKQWGFGKPIIHGMYGNEQEEYWDLPKEMRAVISMSQGGWPLYYNRRVVNDMMTYLDEWGIKPTQLRVDVNFRDFDEFREYIGKSLIGFFPFRESPMPRARTEMMLSGCAVVTTDRQDAGDMFTGLDFKKTEHGSYVRDENGNFIPDIPIEEAEVVWMDVDSAKDGATKIRWLYENPDIALQIGQQGKKAAQRLFSKDRFVDDWHDALTEAGVL